MVALVGYLALTYGRWYHFFRKPKKNTAFTKEEGLDFVEPQLTNTPNLNTANDTTTDTVSTESNTQPDPVNTESHINKE